MSPPAPSPAAVATTPLSPGLRNAADLLAVVSVWLFLAGGVHVSFPLAPVAVAFDFGRFGLLALPLVLICLFRPRQAGELRTVRAARWAARKLAALPVGIRAYVPLAAMAVIAAFQLAGIFARYHAFRAAMDLSIYANACRGKLFATMKGDVWIFADHFEPVLALLTPLCQVAHPSKVLLVTQWLAWIAGAFGARRVARHHGWSPASAWILALAYLQLPGFVTTIMYDFHLLALALGVLPWLWLQAARAAWGRFWLLVFFVWGLKESTALSLAAFGLFVALTDLRRQGSDGDAGVAGRADADQSLVLKRRVHGILLAVTSLLLFVVIMKGVYPHFRGGEGTMYFAKYYGHIGNTMGEFVRTAVFRPLYFLSTFLTPRKLSYAFLLLAPFAGIPLLRPWWLLPAFPAIFINIATNDSNLLRANYHYEAEIFPLLFVATTALVMDERVRAFFVRKRIGFSPRTAWLAVLLVFYSGDGLGYFTGKYRPQERHLDLERKLATLVPRDVPVAANQLVAAHLTDRPRLYMMDYLGMEDDWQRADVIVVAYPWRHIGYYSAERFEREKVPRWQHDFALVYTDPDSPDFRIWKRRVPRKPGAGASAGSSGPAGARWPAP